VNGHAPQKIAAYDLVTEGRHDRRYRGEASTSISTDNRSAAAWAKTRARHQAALGEQVERAATARLGVGFETVSDGGYYA
jgi:hypothetical protein